MAFKALSPVFLSIRRQLLRERVTLKDIFGFILRRFGYEVIFDFGFTTFFPAKTRFIEQVLG